MAKKPPTKPQRKTSATSVAKTKKKSASTPAGEVNAKNKRRSLPARIALIGLKVFFVGMIALVGYTIYLDGKVRNVFEGQRWQMPVKIYGEIAELEVGRTLNLQQLKQALFASGYKQVSYITAPGQFILSKKKMIIQRRVYTRQSQNVPSAQIDISIEENDITALLVNQVPAHQAQLDPFLLDKILPESKEDRLLVTREYIPQQLIDTLLLVEDKDFYQHSGISPSGILRALISNLRAGKTVQGGSTLTQQLVKNMFLTRDKTLWRKANEAIMALILEYHYSKEALLEAYINEVYLGQNYAKGIYGFGLAATFYFNRQLHELSNEQIAMLVGIVKGPSYYDPWRFAKRSKARRDLILQLMLEQGLISIDEYSQSVESTLSIRKVRRLKKQKYPDYLQLVKQELALHVEEVHKYSGINVYTGFSLYSQQALVETLNRKMPHLESTNKGKELQAAMVVTDISSGNITALVGDKVSGYAGFNRALSAKRPIGSLIKPAVYLAALQQYDQFTLASVLEDKAITLRSNSGMEWRPKNYSGEYKGQVSLLDGLTYSLNVPTVNLGMQLGLGKVERVMQQLGYLEAITLRPSLLLGSINMSPIEVNQLYLPIAAQGVAVQAHTINQVVDVNEGIIWEKSPTNHQAISSEASYLLDYALTKVTQEGTAKSLSWRLTNATVAGKTGTTNEQRDSWFVGYDNKHIVTTWVGSDDNSPTALTGSSGALVLFSEFMKLQGVENKQFDAPYGVSVVRFEEKTGNFVSDKCENTIMLPAISEGLVASETCLQNKPKGIKAIGKWFNGLFSD